MRKIRDKDIKVTVKIIKVLKREEGMTVERASKILKDARNILPLITPLKKANQDELQKDFGYINKKSV